MTPKNRISFFSHFSSQELINKLYYLRRSPFPTRPTVILAQLIHEELVYRKVTL